MTEKTTLEQVTLEEAYLHINNGGLTITVVEQTTVWKDQTVYPDDWGTRLRTSAERKAELASLPKEDLQHSRWAVKIEANHFGVSTSYSFPIVPLSVKWLIAALQRVEARMEAKQTAPKSKGYFGNGFKNPIEKQENVRVTAQDGQKVSEYWPVPRETYEASGPGWAYSGSKPPPKILTDEDPEP